MPGWAVFAFMYVRNNVIPPASRRFRSLESESELFDGDAHTMQNDDDGPPLSFPIQTGSVECTDILTG